MNSRLVVSTSRANAGRAELDEAQEPEDEPDRDPDVDGGCPNVPAAERDRGRDCEVHRDEQVLVDEGPEHRLRLVVGDPAEVDERLRDHRRRGDVHDTGDQKRRQEGAEDEPPENEPGAEVREVDRPRRPDLASPREQPIEVELQSEEKRRKTIPSSAPIAMNSDSGM